MALLHEKGIGHEHRYLESLKGGGRNGIKIPARGELSAKVARTAEAMRKGTDVIYQGALFEPPWHGISDRSAERVSNVPWDVKAVIRRRR